jgi:hypothetical protein
MNIQTPIAVTLALLLVSGTLYAKPKKFRQDGPKKTTIVSLELNGNSVGNSVRGTFLFGDRVGDKRDAEPVGRAVPFTGTVKSRNRDDVSMEINFKGKAPLDRKKNPLTWHLKKTVDGHQYLTLPLPPLKLQAWISSQGAF